MVNVVGAESCRKITRHPLVGQCRRVQRPPCLCRDEMEEVGGEVLVISRPGWLPTGFAGAHYPPAIGSCVHTTRHLPGLLLLFCLHLLAPKEELVFKGMVCRVAGHDSEFRRSGGMFENGQGFGDREITWERVYPSSRVSPLRFLAWCFPQTAPIVVFGNLRVNGSSRYSLVTSRLKPAKQTRRRWWCSVVPLMAKLAFFGRLRVRTAVISIKNVVPHLV